MAEVKWFPVKTSPEESSAIYTLCEDLEKTGHQLGPWHAPSEDVAEETGLMFDSFERSCACGIGLVAGWSTRGFFALTPGAPGVYGSCDDAHGKVAPLPREHFERVAARCPHEVQPT